MSLFGIRPHFSIQILLLIFIFSCKSNQNNVSQNSSSTQPELSHVVSNNVPSYAQIRITKIIRNSEENKITSAEADEAFLLGRILEENRDFENAEKLYSISFNYMKNITNGLSLVNSLINLKKYDQALAIVLKLSVLYPHKPEIEINLANIYQLLGENNLVIKTLENAYKHHPNNEAIVIFYASSISKNSKKILENFIIKNPRAINALIALSQKYFKEKNYFNALKYAKEAYKIDSDNVENMTMIGKIEQHNKNYIEAEKYFKIAFEKEIDNNANVQNYVNILLFQKKFQEALAVLLKIEKSSDDQIPFPQEFSFQISKILLVNRDFEGAKKRLLELSKSKFNIVFVNYYLAICSEAMKNFSDAISYLNEIPIDSELNQEVIKAKIIVFLNSNNKIEAEKYFDKFIISDSNLVEDTIFKSNILAFFNKYDNAVQTINESIKKSPDSKELYLKKAEYIKFTSSGKQSISIARKIVEKWPNFSDGLNFLGYSLLEENMNLEYAKKLLYKALALNPQNGFYLDSLGWFYFLRNDFKKSMKYFRQALKYEPDEPVIIYHLAMAQFKDLQYTESLKNFEIINKIIAGMLPYQLVSDPELGKISKDIGAKIIEVQKIINNQTQLPKKDLLGNL